MTRPFRLACIAAAMVSLPPLYGAPVDAAEWTVFCDFESNARAWRPDGGDSGPIRMSTEAAYSGRASLRIQLDKAAQGTCVRATWQTDVDDVRWSPGSRLKFWLRGSERALGPHGGVIFVESGGKVGGGDSHWMLAIEGSVYTRPEWTLVELGPLSSAHNPDWAADANGRIDCERIRRILFVAQQEGPDATNVSFAVFMDDLEVSGVTPRELAFAPAEAEATPDHITPIWRGFRGRARAHPAAVTFTDITGWRAGVRGDGEVRLVRSEEEPCHEDLRYQAKVTYLSRDGSGYFELAPGEPLAIREPFNAVCAWVYGNNWAWMPDPGTPPVEIWVRLVDATGQRHRLNLGVVNFRFYGMLHKRLTGHPESDSRHAFAGGAADGRMHEPVALEAIEIHGGAGPEPRTIYLESVAFYTDDMAQPEFDTGLLEDLPFPTTPDTILPTVARPTTISVTRRDDTYVFDVRGDERIVYRYRPSTGTLSDLSVRVGRRRSFIPCAGAGPAFELGGQVREPGSADATTELIEARLDGNRVTARWVMRAGTDAAEYSISLHVSAKSMVVDWASDDCRAVALRLGEAEQLRQPRLIRVPYLSIYQDRPQVLLSDDTFVLTLLDWYNTGCSEFYSRSELVGESAAVMNGGSAYNRVTDGTRNPLRERQFINVSSRFEEVLPNIPNPPSDQREVLRTHLYTHLGGTAPTRFDTWLETWRRFHRYGIDNVFVTHHEDAWTNGADVGQGAQEYTMCIEAAPEVGDEKLIAYCHALREMGYSGGLYENFTDYNPLGQSWDERNAGRNSDGEMMRVWPPTYAINPLKGLEMAKRYPRMVHEKFGCNTAYRDCHTAYPPWGQVDYRAGRPGAGRFDLNFRAWGALLDDGSDAYGGPVFSEGLHHWFSAGLVDGSYAQINMSNAPGYPLLPDFDLRKIHPLGADISMLPGWEWGRGLYQCQATTIAYGHLGFLPIADLPVVGRYYYMQQALQSRYIMEPVQSILYHRDGKLHDVTEALKSGAFESSQVLVRYENGLEVAVNCNPTSQWRAAVNGKSYDLSTDAWAASLGEEFEEFCTEVEGRRVGYVRSPEYVFADGGGRWFDFGLVATDGAVAIRPVPHASGAHEMLVIAPATAFEIPAAMGDAIEALDEAGAALGPVAVTPSGERLRFDAVGGAASYRVGRAQEH